MTDSWIKVLDPNFINAELIGPVGSEKVVTIMDIDEREAFDQKKQKKEKRWSLIFAETLPLILNKTNTKTLIRLFGADRPQNCVGHKVILYVVNVKVGGQQTTGIRIKEYTEETIKCESCGKLIRPAAGKSVKELAEIAKRNTGKALCLDCMKKAKEKQDAEQG